MKKIYLAAACAASFFLCGATYAAESAIRVYAAGSLTGVLTEIIHQYTADTGQKIELVSGPAGLLRERIEKGEPADLFLSANFAHPAKLAAEGKGTPAVVFVRNSLCVVSKPSLGLTSANLLDKLLQPGIKIGTSTPGADPGGDYTWQWFAYVEKFHPGARENLEAKAQKLVGGAVPPKIPGNGDAGKYFMEQGKVNVFFGYCSSRNIQPDPDLAKVRVPDELSLPIEDGMTVLTSSNDLPRQTAAYRFALQLFTPDAQRRFKAYGFVPTTDASAAP